MRRKDTVEANDGNPDAVRHMEHVAVQLFGKGMGSIDQQTYVVLAAESRHFVRFHCPRQSLSVDQLQRLAFATCAIVKRLACFLQFGHGHAPLCCAAKNQNHASPFLKR